MSINEKIINNNNIEKEIKNPFFSFSPEVNSKTNKFKQDSFSQDLNSKKNNINNNITNFSTIYQTFSPSKQECINNNNENENTIDNKIKDIYQNSFNNSEYLLSKNNKKPRLSLKESRTKLKQLRDKLYPLSESERIEAQEELLPVPLEKMNDEKFKILRMHKLKKASLPEYKSCEKYDNYYKSFEDSIKAKNDFFLLKNKKPIYSNTKVMKLEISLKNKKKEEKKFPLYKDQDIGVYEYWQAPLIESKIDEDIDSDEEQINLARKVCDLDLMEGIKYIQKNGIESIFNYRFKNKKEESNFINKSASI